MVADPGVEEPELRGLSDVQLRRPPNRHRKRGPSGADLDADEARLFAEFSGHRGRAQALKHGTQGDTLRLAGEISGSTPMVCPRSAKACGQSAAISRRKQRWRAKGRKGATSSENRCLESSEQRSIKGSCAKIGLNYRPTVRSVFSTEARSFNRASRVYGGF